MLTTKHYLRITLLSQRRFARNSGRKFCPRMKKLGRLCLINSSLLLNFGWIRELARWSKRILCPDFDRLATRGPRWSKVADPPPPQSYTHTPKKNPPCGGYRVKMFVAALYVAVTLYISVTGQFFKNFSLYFLWSWSVYNSHLNIMAAVTFLIFRMHNFPLPSSVFSFEKSV